MKKIIFLMAILLWALAAFSQKEDVYSNTTIKLAYVPDTIVLGYISTYTHDTINIEKDYQEFAEVVLFISLLGIEVVDICKEDGLILMVLNEKWKDEYAVIDEINKTFTGTCYFKISNNSFYHSSCEGKVKKNKKLIK
jgi:hypothetical protein